jgi:hypothetical protein
VDRVFLIKGLIDYDCSPYLLFEGIIIERFIALVGELKRKKCHFRFKNPDHEKPILPHKTDD